MKLITVCNKEHPGLDLWRATAKKAGHEPIVLGLGSGALGHDAGGFGLKLIILAKYLQTLMPNELCIVLDGYDVVIRDSPEKIQEKLKIMTKPVLFSAEKYENPDQGNPYLTPNYLNAGAYAGNASAILYVLKPFLENPSEKIDDQRFYTRRMFSRPDLIQLDTESKVFQNIFNEEPGDASILHFPGYYKNLECMKNTEFWHLAQKIHRPRKVFSRIFDLVAAFGEILPGKNNFLKGLILLAIFLIQAST